MIKEQIAGYELLSSDGVGLFLEAVPEERLVFTNALPRAGSHPATPG
ncbi:hypothetical protein [Sinorhizobium fredii]|nr:hypothetical protein [Sinorhizobium fredii]